ncbi:hypothetical protein DERP_012820 [Dermatophagoides pteronyssinus]|uniref:Uncharacterized protein n=1 Tax=Dermatophagoides pteronyssinus TaxID=6956 RepID=A0ABQ8JFQ0_DERPT|nr:hypothetical protein DERP_012820 [Dermatophagoides pteronyssinus]
MNMHAFLGTVNDIITFFSQKICSTNIQAKETKKQTEKLSFSNSIMNIMELENETNSIQFQFQEIQIETSQMTNGRKLEINIAI